MVLGWPETVIPHLHATLIVSCEDECNRTERKKRGKRTTDSVIMCIYQEMNPEHHNIWHLVTIATRLRSTTDIIAVTGDSW